MYFFEEFPVSNGFTNNPTLIINNKFVKPYDQKKGHSGADVIMPIGTPLILPVDAICLQARYQTEMGHTIYLQIQNGDIIICGHNSELRFSKGDRVKAGDVFALSGNTGTISTNPHSHVEVLSQKPQEGYEHMTRVLGEFSGFNHEPISYLKALKDKPVQVATEADLALRRFQSEGIIRGDHDLSQPFSAGEVLIILNRLFPKK